MKIEFNLHRLQKKKFLDFGSKEGAQAVLTYSLNIWVRFSAENDKFNQIGLKMVVSNTRKALHSIIML